MRIDAHQHFWRYTTAEYGWIDDSMRGLRRDFLPADLAVELKTAGIDGAISVQARQTIEETEWLLSLAAGHEFLRGVVGWLPLVDPAVEETIARLSANPKLRALRHVVQDEPDDRYILRDDFNRGVDVAGRYGLAYDILVFERHLPQTIDFVDRHPDMVLVVDHVAKPRIREGVIEPWRTSMRELARRPNAYCKLSGMVTEADWERWSADDLAPYVETVLEAFTPGRVMFGSDWPVCTVAAGYAQWCECVERFVGRESPVWGETAQAAYRYPPF